ncbi:MAG: hypothetical protein IPP17_00665 [Bacteroidetes bacterium]|nr:hypothetical protein [Bacteroidota bacterium]
MRQKGKPNSAKITLISNGQTSRSISSHRRVWFYFSHSQDETIRDKVFLRPDLLTSYLPNPRRLAFFRGGTFDRRHVWTTLGRTKQQVSNLLKNPTGDDETEMLLQLMRQFKLIFCEGADEEQVHLRPVLAKEPMQAVKLSSAFQSQLPHSI